MAPSDKRGRLIEEIIAISSLSLAVFIGCCLISYNPSDPSLNTADSSGIQEINNWGGIVGSYIADALFQLIGLSAFIVPVTLIWISLKLFLPSGIKMKYFILLSYFCFFISLSAMFSLVWVEPKIRIASFSYELSGGGVVGSQLAELSLKFLNRLGSYTLFSLVGVVSLIIVTNLSLLKLAQRCGMFLSWFIKGIVYLSSLLLKGTGKVKKLYRVVLSVVRAAESLYTRWKMEGIVTERGSPLASRSLFPVRKVKKGVSKRTFSQKQESKEGKGDTETSTEYQIPPLSLLDTPSQRVSKADKEVLKENSKVLESKLADFGVQGKVVEVNPGPVIVFVF